MSIDTIHLMELRLLLAFDDAGDRTVVFRSNRSGGSFTKQGRELLDNNNFTRITVDGESGLDEPNSSLQLNEESIRTLMNDAATKSLEKEAKRIESQQRDEVGPVATSITNERTASDASQKDQPRWNSSITHRTIRSTTITRSTGPNKHRCSWTAIRSKSSNFNKRK